ncbi:MAG: family 16 glycoside hydrolase [Bacteroidota bacterium]
MIKRTLLVLLTLFIFHPAVNAQDKKDERTQTTKIADLLAELPAKNTQQFNRNMQEIAQLGVDGYVNLIKGLNTNDQAYQALISYAVSGYSGFVSQNNRVADRKMAEKAYINALKSITDVQQQAFLISQFELVGDEESVTALAQYLNQSTLVDVSTRALAKINTPAAKNALLKALTSANGRAKQSIIVALGHSGLKSASQNIITAMANNADVNLTKVALFALANLGEPSAEPTLAKAAAAVNYAYDQTNAVSNYILFVNNIKVSDRTLALKIAKEVQAKSTEKQLTGARIAALNLLVELEPSVPHLVNAVDDSSFQYRAAALKIARPIHTVQMESDLVKKLGKANVETQVLLINFFADVKSKTALPGLAKLIKSKDQLVRDAAITAVGEIGQEEALTGLLKNLNKAQASDLPAYTNAILRMKGETVSAKVASALPKGNAASQVLLLNILANKAASAEIKVVFDALNSKDQEVKTAAYAALKSMVTTEHLPQLFTLLNESAEASASIAVQDAIIVALKNANDKDQQIEGLLGRLKTIDASKQAYYYNILASLGGSKALAAVNESYKNGNKAALTALTNWKDKEAAESLIQIARANSSSDDVNKAVNGFLRLTKAASLPAEQRLLWLRNAMAIAQTNTQKQQILKDAEQAKIINTLIFAGKYLNEPALQQAAAQTIMVVSLAGKYNGELVKNLMNQTISVLTGADSDYQKEAMRKYIADMTPGEGFVSMYNGKDLTGWQGLVGNPIKRAKMDPKLLDEAQAKANTAAQASWKPINDELHFMIKGDNLATIKKYGDFEMLVDWKIIDDKKGEGDAGIYLRGTPQVQMWDNARVNVGAQVGSGGLYNNQKNPSKPLKVADNKLDEWNTFRIIMVGDRVTVYLNGELVTDNVMLENYWDRNLPIFNEEQIELQAHGSPVAYRDLYIKEIPRAEPFKLSDQEVKEGFTLLFDGSNMHNWTGNTVDYIIENGNMAIRPKPGKGSGGNLFTKNQYSDFNFRFEFKLTPGANNGLGIRAPLQGDAAYEGIELQILDNDAAIYKSLKEYQYHGSAYGISPAKRGSLKPVGEWNYQEVIVQGAKIKVILNGEVILDTDISDARKNGAADGKKHPGLLRESGHIGFLGHGSPVEFRNIRIKELSKK